MLSTIEEKKESFNNLLKNYTKESSQDFKLLAYEEKSPIFDEFFVLCGKMSFIEVEQETIQEDLIKPLEHAVRQLLKEYSKNRINSSLINTIIEAQQQYCAIM